MSTQNDFLTIAVNSSNSASSQNSNTMLQTAYSALSSYQTNGYPNLAIVPAQQFNKSMRQFSVMAYILAQFVCDEMNVDAIDDGNPTTIATLLLNFKSAVNKASQFPSSTRMPFAQESAPTGWTQDVTDTATNRMIRVVNDGTGNATGGSDDPTVMDVVPSHAHTFTTGIQSADHTHIDPGHSHTTIANPFTAVYVAGSGDAISNATGGSNTSTTSVSLSNQTTSHTHGGIVNGNASASNWTPRYLNMIIGIKS